MTAQEIPRLSSFGVEIDTGRESFGFLRDSSDALPSPRVLRQRMKRDGYLYLRGFWKREEVKEVRLSILRQLRDLGFIDLSMPLEHGKAFAGKGAGRAFGNPLDQRNPKLLNLLYGDRMMSFFDRFLGGPTTHFDFTWFRTKIPGYGSPAHCDTVYMGRGTFDLYSVWTPLDDFELALGGLMILEDSHTKQEILQQYLKRDVDSYCENRPGAAAYKSAKTRWDGTLSKDARRLQNRLGGRWLTAEYRLGDIVIFGMATVHAGLDNHTDRIRLSTDSRYQLASEPIDERWVGEKPVGHGAAMKRGRIC